MVQSRLFVGVSGFPLTLPSVVTGANRRVSSSLIFRPNCDAQTRSHRREIEIFRRLKRHASATGIPPRLLPA